MVLVSLAGGRTVGMGLASMYNTGIWSSWAWQWKIHSMKLNDK